jgi:hypothetical protein
MLLPLLDDVSPEQYLGLYTGEKSDVDILTFFRLDMATGRFSSSLGLAARPLSAWCLDWGLYRLGALFRSYFWYWDWDSLTTAIGEKVRL